MTKPIYFAPLRVPFVDLQTGLISHEWQLLLQGMFARIGGTNGISISDVVALLASSDADLQQLLNEDLDIAGADQLSTAQALADARALDADLPDPPSSDAADALMLLLDTQDGSSGGASPTAKVGTSAVNGSASTFMRSDGAPPIDVAIAPTWSNLHTFSAGISISGATNPLLVQGGANQYMAIFTASSTSGQSLGMRVNAGTTVADVSFQVNSQNVATTFFQIGGTGIAKFFGNVGFNNAVPPAQPTGYGTPTGGAHQASFAAASITLPNLAAAVAQLIIELKAYGLIGA